NSRSQDSGNCMMGTRIRYSVRTVVAAYGRSAELRQEAQVAVEELAQVVDAVAQHRQAVRAHAEREADVALGVQPEVPDDVRVHLAGAGHLQPAALERAAREGDVDLGRGLGER